MSTARPKILVVDDEAPIRKFLHISLEAAGYQIIETENGAGALRLLEAETPDLLILDLGLPDEDGQEIIVAIRARSMVPIIVLSVRNAETEKIRALDAGANDFVSKPFATGELLARVRAILRFVSDAPGTTGMLECGPLRVDLEGHRVSLNDETVKLTPREYDLLVLLMRHPGKVLTHATLLREIWGDTHEADTHYLRIYVRQLRKKLGDDPLSPRFIVNEPGVGYRLAFELGIGNA